MEDAPERHREPNEIGPIARTPRPDAIRAQATRVKVAEKTSLCWLPALSDMPISSIAKFSYRELMLNN